MREGRHSKFVKRIEQICYSARFAEAQGRRAVRDRARGLPRGRGRFS